MSSSRTPPGTSASPRREESGQALVELLLVILISLMIGIAIYETGALLHNLSVLDEAAHTAVVYASHGADYDTLRDAVNREAVNLMAGGFLEQTVPRGGLIVEVWNPHYDRVLGHGGSPSRSQCHEAFSPGRSNVAPYMFWARGYEIRVGLIYRIGFYIPFLKPITTQTVISESAIIQASNDLDRDGMNDHWEVAYVEGAMRAPVTSDTPWKHPQHRDGADTYYDVSRGVDIDGDGMPIADDDRPYDRDNNNVEDQFERDPGDGSVNKMEFSPLMGPAGWRVGPCT